MTTSAPWLRPALLTLLLTAAVATSAFPPSARGQEDVARSGPRVDVLHVEGAITPVVATYLERGLTDAQASGVDLVVIRLDTPGGSVQVTEGLMKEMAASDVPIAVWVGPSGAKAASAGTFITLAAHVAAMAPGTSIGAASPVGPQGGDLPETIKSKMTSMLVTTMRALAKRRGRDAQNWVESAIVDARSDDAATVKELGVIDLIARDIPDLLRQITAPYEIRLRDRRVYVELVDAQVRDVEMGAVEKILHTISDPSVAYLLLALGMLGLFFEFANPGFGLAGVVGAICLLFGSYALGVLPANYAGVALIVVAFALFFADAKLGTSGLLAMGGIVAMAAGGMLLFDSPIFAVSPVVIWTTSIACGLFFAFVAGAAFRAQRLKPATGSEAMVGAQGLARSRLSPDGLVVVWGETWRATAEDGPLDKGAAVEVTEVEGLRVRVRAVVNEETHEN